MKRYKIKYKEKEYVSKGENAVEAFEKFANRPVYGKWNPLISSYELDMYDADTRGGSGQGFFSLINTREKILFW